jgi:hypothetical protein
MDAGLCLAVVPDDKWQWESSVGGRYRVKLHMSLAVTVLSLLQPYSAVLHYLLAGVLDLIRILLVCMRTVILTTIQNVLKYLGAAL